MYMKFSPSVIGSKRRWSVGKTWTPWQGGGAGVDKNSCTCVCLFISIFVFLHMFVYRLVFTLLGAVFILQFVNELYLCLCQSEKSAKVLKLGNCRIFCKFQVITCVQGRGAVESLQQKGGRRVHYQAGKLLSPQSGALQWVNFKPQSPYIFHLIF